MLFRDYLTHKSDIILKYKNFQLEKLIGAVLVRCVLWVLVILLKTGGYALQEKPK